MRARLQAACVKRVTKPMPSKHQAYRNLSSLEETIELFTSDPQPRLVSKGHILEQVNGCPTITLVASCSAGTPNGKMLFPA
jgi:hypothetical protein